MADLRFEWDPTKAGANSTKHGISFEEASTVFFDDYALFLPDPEHSESEDTDTNMKKSYDFSKAKRNPFAKRLKKQITIRIDNPTLDYFHGLSEELGIPYQTLINLYLSECAEEQKRPSMDWQAAT